MKKRATRTEIRTYEGQRTVRERATDATGKKRAGGPVHSYTGRVTVTQKLPHPKPATPKQVTATFGANTGKGNLTTVSKRSRDLARANGQRIYEDSARPKPKATGAPKGGKTTRRRS